MDNTRLLELLNRQFPTGIVDYQMLCQSLQDYHNPRDKISRLVNDQMLIRIKKGLYVLQSFFQYQLGSKELLANLLYGPSAVSLEYALGLYHLIPERVTTITSITNNKNKLFQTPLGNFSYRYLESVKYNAELTFMKIDKNFRYLIAKPEKALVDTIYLHKKHLTVMTIDQLANLLFADLRIDEQEFLKLSAKAFAHLAAVYRQPFIETMNLFIKNRRN